jgi:hypothetical protein
MAEQSAQRVDALPGMGGVCMAQYVGRDDPFEPHLSRGLLDSPLHAFWEQVVAHPGAAPGLVAVIFCREKPEPRPCEGCVWVLQGEATGKRDSDARRILPIMAPFHARVFDLESQRGDACRWYGHPTVLAVIESFR